MANWRCFEGGTMTALKARLSKARRLKALSAALGRFTSPAAVAVAVLTLWAGLAAAADNPFPSLVGSWSGAGEIVLDSGQTEKMACKGYYTGQGAGLGLAIRCANPSSKIDLRATLTYAAGTVGGTWEERTYNAGGSVVGKASADKVMLKIDGGGLDASMAVVITAASHAVMIATQGTGIKSVNIKFNRS